MIYVLIGEEDYLIEEKLEELGLKDRIVFSLKDKELKHKISQYLNQRLFADNNDFCVVLKDCDKIDIETDFLNYFKNKTAIFIFKQRPELFIKKLKDLKIEYKIEEIPNLSFKKAEDFEKFLLEYTKKHSIKLPFSILKTLSQVFLNYPTILLNDFKKLKYYKPDGEFTREEVINLIRWPTDSQVFKLVDALIEKNYSNFIMGIKREINIGTKIEFILGFLCKTLLRIFLMKKIKPYQRKLLDSLDIKPAYQWRLKEYSKKITEDEIKRIIRLLSEIDRKYKKFILKDKDLVYEIAKIFKT